MEIRKEDEMKIIKKIIDFLLPNILSIYFIAIVVTIILYARACITEPTVEATTNGTFYVKVVATEEPVEIILNTCNQADIQSEKLGKHEPVTYLEEVPLSKDLQEYIFKMCDKYSISPYLIFAIIERESNFVVEARGDNGESYGLMQIKKKYQKERMKQLGVNNLQNPKTNILVGIDYLYELFEQYEDVGYVLHCYNGGQAYANRLDKKGKTSKYASAILARAEELERGVEGN